MNELERRLNRETLRHAVGRTITCIVTGEILDVRNAVLVEAWRGDRLTTSLVVSAGAYDERVKANVASTSASRPDVRLVVLDGREIFA